MTTLVHHHHLLLLLGLVPLVFSESVYYVRPTTDHSTRALYCPRPESGQPCLTLGNYYSNGYFSSNTTFKFLPGVHAIDRSLILAHVQNVTFEAALPGEGGRPLLKFSEISCSYDDSRYFDYPECSSVYMKHVNNIVVRGIELQSSVLWDTDTSNQSTLTTGEVRFHSATNVLLHDVAAARGVVALSSTGINVTDCIFGQRNNNLQEVCTIPKGFRVSSARYGIFLQYTSDCLLSNVTIVNAIYHGVHLQGTNRVQLLNTVSLNTVYGTAIRLQLAQNTYIYHPVLVACSSAHLPILDVVQSRNTAVDRLAISGGSAGIVVKGSIDTVFLDLDLSMVNGESSSVHVYVSTDVTFKNCSFTNFKTPMHFYTDVVSLPATVSTYFSLGVLFEDCVFSQNHMTGISARASNITFLGEIEFSGNKASAGAAIILAKESNVTLLENCAVSFINNSAYSTGGAVHIVTGEDALEQSQGGCFLHVRGRRDRTYMKFEGNSAGKAGDVLFGGHLAIGFNGINSNCLQNFWNATSILQDGLSTIASEASRVCLCNSSGYPDCLKLIDTKRHAIFPGQTITVSIANVGQAFGTVSGSVFAQFIQVSPTNQIPRLEQSQYTQAVGKDSCSLLNYTIYQSPNGSSDTILTLTSQFKKISYFLSNESIEVKTTLHKYRLWTEMKYAQVPFPKSILEFPLYVNVTLRPCPLGFELGTTPAKCMCSKHLRGLDNVECDINDEAITRSGIVWIGIDKDANEVLMTSEYCPLDYCKSEQVWIRRGDFDSQCNYDHSGILCGECRAGLSLALGSPQCLPCSNWYLVLILPFALAGIGLVVFLKLINLTVAHGMINGLVFYVNVVKANEYIFLPQKATNPLTVFIAWTNLDLGIETCFWDGLSAYSKTWLQFVFPLYLWVIAGGIVLVSKYSSRVARWMGNNSVAVLATLFLLSYAKLLRTIIVGLSYTVIESSKGSKIVWSADGNLEFLGAYHAPLFAVCIATLLFLWLPYTLLLFSGQWLYKSKIQLVVKLLGKIKPFLDAYYGPLKGRHRYWFGAQLLIRAAILLISSCVPTNSSSTVVFSVSVSAVVLSGLSFFGFYQKRKISIFELSFFMNLSLLGLSAFFAANTKGNPTKATYILVAVVFAQFIGLTFYQLTKFKSIAACLDRLCKRCGLFKQVDDAYDWDIYECVALAREREVSEDFDQHNSNSVDITMSDGVPTY